MSDTTTRPAANAAERLAALQAHGANRVDPMRWTYLQALARRSAAHAGATRALLDARLAAAIDAYDVRCAQAADGTDPVTVHEDHGTPLRELLDRLAATLDDAPTPAVGALAELATAARHRDTWSRLGVERRLHQSLAQVPGNAGPLNSQALAARALRLMRELSPGYLDHFMTYVDALLWLDDAAGGPLLIPRDVVRGPAEVARKPERKRRR